MEIITRGMMFETKKRWLFLRPSCIYVLAREEVDYQRGEAVGGTLKVFIRATWVWRLIYGWRKS